MTLLSTVQIETYTFKLAEIPKYIRKLIFRNMKAYRETGSEVHGAAAIAYMIAYSVRELKAGNGGLVPLSFEMGDCGERLDEFSVVNLLKSMSPSVRDKLNCTIWGLMFDETEFTNAQDEKMEDATLVKKDNVTPLRSTVAH